MKRLLLVLLFAGFAASVCAQVKFETRSTDAVRALAEKTGKLVFIDLYASWCPPCRMMDRHVFSRRDVGAFMEQRFVSAKYDTDRTIGRELLARYGQGAVPTYLIFDTAGELLGRIEGASSAETFMRDIDSILARQRPKP